MKTSKNKEAARKCRARKKQYVEGLYDKIKSLEEETDSYKIEL